jgi:hypothetical protein
VSISAGDLLGSDDADLMRARYVKRMTSNLLGDDMTLSDANYLRLLQAIALEQLIVPSTSSIAHWSPGARFLRRSMTRLSCKAATTDANDADRSDGDRSSSAGIDR